LILLGEDTGDFGGWNRLRTIPEGWRGKMSASAQLWLASDGGLSALRRLSPKAFIFLYGANFSP
jgi:hypothetical protein